MIRSLFVIVCTQIIPIATAFLLYGILKHKVSSQFNPYIYIYIRMYICRIGFSEIDRMDKCL